MMVCLEKHRFWLYRLLKDEKYWEESEEYYFKTILDNLIIHDFWKGNLVAMAGG